MTTIAYRNDIMAGDSCVADDEIRVLSMNKLVRLKSGALWGSAGDADDRAVRALLEGVKSAEKMPTTKQLRETEVDCQGIFVLPRGDVFTVTVGFEEKSAEKKTGGWYAEVAPTRAPVAVGKGWKIALAAMWCNRSAEQAVALACKLELNTRLPVHTMPRRPTGKTRTRKTKRRRS